MGVWLEGKPPADRVREFVKNEALRLRAETGAIPGLTAVLIGDNKSSLSYVRTKEKACQALGLNGNIIHLPAETTMETLHARLRALNDDDSVDGILVQLPLPNSRPMKSSAGFARIRTWTASTRKASAFSSRTSPASGPVLRWACWN